MKHGVMCGSPDDLCNCVDTSDWQVPPMPRTLDDIERRMRECFSAGLVAKTKGRGSEELDALVATMRKELGGL